ncbi:MAG TPA: SCO family protein [Schlesneria sp.]|jgi:protein SCO1/2/putative membrane protein
MSQLHAEIPKRSFFQTPAFWIGNVFWLILLFAALGIARQKPAAPVADSTPDAETPVEENKPSQPQITITTDKDGNSKVVLPGENPESPWDKDGIADFSFTDTDGNKVTKTDLLGKPWVVCFVFTHCAATCPRVTSSMRELQDQLKDYDFRLVTVTVDPVRDTPEVLKQYGKNFKADFSKWMFLGGDQRDIYRLIHGSFKMPVQELDDDKKQYGFEFIHSNNMMLVDDKGVVKGKYDATKGPAVAALRREIQKMANRLSDGGDSKKTDEK